MVCMKAILPMIWLLAAPWPLCAQTSLPLENPGFEDGVQGWEPRESPNMTESLPEAARTGKEGVRIKDDDSLKRAALLSTSLPVKPDHNYRVTFWARTTEAGAAGVYLQFFSGSQLVRDESGRYYGTRVDKADGEWHEYVCLAKALAAADSVRIALISTQDKQSTVDFDDFTLEEIAP